MFDITALRAQFPILQETINGRPLIYLDNAASTQKPLCVLNASRQYYERINANIHRGVHTLSQRATTAHEDARESVAQFLNAPTSKEIIFTSGCTEGINLVAQILRESGRIKKNDEIIVSELEHHSNIVPWQLLCQRTGAHLKVIPLLSTGEWDIDAFTQLLSKNTQVLAISHVSNALGLVNPVAECIHQAKTINPEIICLIDGAQSTPHMKIDVQALGCDFFAFSGHKIYAPTGIGVLWGRTALLEQLPPWKGGGEMIAQVTFAKTTYNELPFKYEAGTPNIEGAIALAEALRFTTNIGWENITQHEEQLTQQCLTLLQKIPLVKIIGTGQKRAGVISFNVEDIHPYDMGVILDQLGVAVRTGHHCCQPLMAHYNIPGTIRVSFAIYNTTEEVIAFISALQKAINMLH